MSAGKRARDARWIPLADGGGVLQRPAANEGDGAARSGPDVPAQAPVESPQESPYSSPEEHPDSRPGGEDDTPEELPPQRPGSVER